MYHLWYRRRQGNRQFSRQLDANKQRFGARRGRKCLIEACFNEAHNLPPDLVQLVKNQARYPRLSLHMGKTLNGGVNKYLPGIGAVGPDHEPEKDFVIHLCPKTTSLSPTCTHEDGRQFKCADCNRHGPGDACVNCPAITASKWNRIGWHQGPW